MACRSTTPHRINYAVRLLLKGHSACAVVAQLADREGISRRSARRYVARAYQQIVDDLEDAEVDRRQLTAQTIHMLQQCMAKALDHNHVSAAVGAARELRELTGIGYQANTAARQHHA